METSEKKELQQEQLDQHVGQVSETSNDAERKVLSKFDMFVMPQMSLLVLFAYLDRTNIGNLTATS